MCVVGGAQAGGGRHANAIQMAAAKTAANICGKAAWRWRRWAAAI